MNKFKLIALLVLCMSVYCLDAAGKTNKRKNIEKIFSLTMNKDMLTKTANQVVDQVHASGIDKYGPREKLSQTKLEAIKKETNKFTENCFKELTSEKCLKKIYVAYESNFNDKEIEDLLKFYESSTGRKMISKMPEIMIVTTNLVMTIMQNQLPIYTQKIDNILLSVS